MSNVQNPSFTDDFVSRMALKSRPAEGYFCLLVSDSQLFKSDDPEKNKGTKLKLTWRMLKDPNNTESFTGKVFNTFLTLPMGDENDPSWAPSEMQVDDACGLLSAFFPEEVDDVPRFVGERGHKQLTYKGEHCDKDDETINRMEAVASAHAKAKEIAADPSILANRVLYARVAHSKGDFLNLRDYASEPQTELSDTYVDQGNIEKLRAEMAKRNGTSAPAKKNGTATKSRRR